MYPFVVLHIRDLKIRRIRFACTRTSKYDEIKQYGNVAFVSDFKGPLFPFGISNVTYSFTERNSVLQLTSLTKNKFGYGTVRTM